jgi:IclR family transcriptional regulator, acetate operon repressor
MGSEAGGAVPLSETDLTAGTESATRVADVLLTLGADPGPLGVSALARRLGLSKAVVHRILRSLESRALVAFDPERRAYTLGPAAAALGARALRDLDLRGVALPVLRRLQERTGETTTLSALIGAERVYLDQVPSRQEIKMTVELGRPFPLYAGASSKAILAFAPAGLRARVLEGPLEPLTARTPLDRAALAAELEDIARAGVAVSLGERQQGAGSVAAPVFGVDGTAVGALSASGPVDRFDEATVARIAPLVREAAAEVSAGLGAPVPAAEPERRSA